MKVYSKIVSIKTYGPMVLHPLHNLIIETIVESYMKIKNGVLWLSVEGATPALLILRKGLEKIFIEYISNLLLFKNWRHGNAYAHLISTIFSTSVVIPIIDQTLMLGNNEEVYLLETRSVYNHSRRIIIEIHSSD